MFLSKGHCCNTWKFEENKYVTNTHLKEINNRNNMKEEGTDKDIFVDVGQTVSIERNKR